MEQEAPRPRPKLGQADGRAGEGIRGTRRAIPGAGDGVTSVLNTQDKGDCQEALSRERPAVTHAH